MLIVTCYIEVEIEGAIMVLIRKKTLLFVTGLSLLASACSQEEVEDKRTARKPGAAQSAGGELPYEEAPISLLEPDPSLTCDSALAQLSSNQEKIRNGDKLTPELAAAGQAASIKTLSCNLPLDGSNTVVTLGKDTTKAYKVSRGEKFEKLCQSVVDVAGGKIVEKAGGTAGSVATLYGRAITCPSGAEAIQKKQGALLILSPNLVQGRYATKALLLKLRLYDNAKRAGQDLEEYVKENKDNIALTSIFSPAVIADKLTDGKVSDQAKRIDDDLDITENVKDTGKSVEETAKKICGKFC